MVTNFTKFLFTAFLIVTISGCSSRGAAEVGCNFTSGTDHNKYDKEASGSSNFLNSIFLGLFNTVLQGAHRVVSPDTYDSCGKEDVATCIDSDGNIKKECTLTK
jgi:hypothetical protein